MIKRNHYILKAIVISLFFSHFSNQFKHVSCQVFDGLIQF
ncbi:hypothetical protein HMPREF0793_1186 [Staphylococcus caprae M23864:W1]|nr:hypothetical protein HMPREF0793_1186 [Staphylococcus caprae M23864:W1]